MTPRRIAFALALCTIAVIGVEAQNRGPAPIRFREMDQNNDRVISRTEWRGSAQSFKVHDWNGNGVLSGDEVRVGGRRPARRVKDDDFDSADREYVFDDWSASGFAALDHNRDGRIARDEWHFDREGFLRADHDGDGVISRAEFLSEDAEDDDRDDLLADLDLNNDGRLTRDEWHGSTGSFNALDRNGDGFVSRAELVGAEPPADLFASVDINRDASISRTEWHWSRESFDSRDSNHDGRLTRNEFNGTAPAASQSSAYRAGGQRGMDEGRAAGHEDRVRNQGWDLEGQQELETADSGYDPRFGVKLEYQAGYRESFRRAYREGWYQP